MVNKRFWANNGKKVFFQLKLAKKVFILNLSLMGQSYLICFFSVGYLFCPRFLDKMQD